MTEWWSYDKEKRLDKAGRRWHFVRRDFSDPSTPYEERPVELYFRDEERKQYGLLRFEHQKDIPFRNYLTMINKIMNDHTFRLGLLAPDTKHVWNRNWK
jgi:hypothetical protein